MQLRYLCTEHVVTIGPDESIDAAIGLFEEHRIRHLPVVRDGVLVGVLSQGDVFAAVGGLLSEDRVSSMDPTVPFAGPTQVEEVMSTDVTALPPEAPLIDAARLMLEQQIASVVIVGGEGVMGIVSERDYLSRFCDSSTIVPADCCRQSVADHMAQDVVYTSPERNVFTLLREMAGRIHHLPVVEDDRLVGVLSDHDVWRAMAIDNIEKIRDSSDHTRLVAEAHAGNIMNSDVVTVGPGDTLADAARLMIDNAVGCTPVVKDGKLIGMLTETDLMRACVNALAQ